MDYGFTAGLEEQLDDITTGKEEWIKVLNNFWKDFNLNVSKYDMLIDFNQNLFETSLDLYHMQLGGASFSSSGRLYDGGYFHSRDGQSRTVGAVSLDGEESGYFFDFFNWDGLVQGISLWDAQR